MDSLRDSNAKIISLGMHAGIIQSILDYDFLLGKASPSILAIVAKGRSQERFFWGRSEVSLPVYPALGSLPLAMARQVDHVINVQSARHVRTTTVEALESLDSLKVISIFAENTPELHALQIRQLATQKKVIVVGPSSVGLLLPGYVKLGAIGGTLYDQLVDANIRTAGDVAVITTSGGIVNELIRMVTGQGHGVSFALAMGGDRYPVTEPVDAFMLAQNDPATKRIVYFGELGGTDEYAIVQLMQDGTITKPVIAYIAGKVAELFPTPPQFGHAKALAQSQDESAHAKKVALAAAGAIVCERFGDIASSLGSVEAEVSIVADDAIEGRRKSYFMSHISGEVNGNVQLLGSDLVDTVNKNSLASLTISMLLGEQVQSKKLTDFVDYVLRLLSDHSPNVSGAVNTMIASRAGKDLVSSLTAGLLTIGPRFGGAINAAAKNWLDGVDTQADPQRFTEEITRRDGAISGIGHKKYRLDLPDPRVASITAFAPKRKAEYLAFARSIETITLTKKANLILNVDGAIAAVMLDLLKAELKYTDVQLKKLVDIEFFNALFVLSRSIGFTAHYLDQRRNDEGLFRLNDDDLRYFPR